MVGSVGVVLERWGLWRNSGKGGSFYWLGFVLGSYQIHGWGCSNKGAEVL